MPTKPEELLEGLFQLSDHMYTELCLEASKKKHPNIFAYLGALAKQLADCEKGVFWRWDKQREVLWTVNEKLERIELPEQSGLTGKALQLGQPIVSNTPNQDPDFAPDFNEKNFNIVRSVLAFPVADGKGQLIGAFQLTNSLSENGLFNKEAVCKRLSLAAFLCGTVMESEAILDDLHHDPVTLLKNRHGFYSDYSKKYFRQIIDTRSDRALSIFVCEIDNFAELSASGGSETAELALRHIAGILSKNRRENDDVYRWDDKTFLMVLSDTDATGCLRAAERIRRLIADSVCSTEGQARRLTVSCGCAAYDKAKSLEENLSAAGAHLSIAQESGGNQVRDGRFVMRNI